MAFYEESKRSITKAISYRILIIISTSLIVFIFTGDFKLTMGVAVSTSISNTLLYYFHERFWNKIRWGKKKQ